MGAPSAPDDVGTIEREAIMKRRIAGAVLSTVFVLAACSSSGDDTHAGEARVATPTAGSGIHTFTVIGDPALDASFLITMKLLDGYEGDDVVFGSDGGQGISTWSVRNVYANPCHSNDTLFDPPVGSSVDALVAGLASQKGHPSTAPTDVEVDGYAGKYIEMTVPAGIDVADCDHGEFRTWADRYLESGQRDMLWIIDVDGDRLVIDAALGPETTPQDRADRTQMVESIQIEPI
jgi:hypothetical protein